MAEASGESAKTAFDERLADLCGSIDGLESRVKTAEARAQEEEVKAERYAIRLANTEAQLEIVLSDFANSLEVQESLTREVEALHTQLQHQHVDSENEVILLQHTLEHECVEKARIRTTLASVQLDRDDAVAELGSAYADMQAMQAALLDSALYVRFLRARLVEAQLAKQRACSADTRENVTPNIEDASTAFSLERTKEAIRKAVQEAGTLDGPERAKRVKQLRLRWHPDKNPVLQDVCSEVTKIINEAITDLNLE